MDLLGYFDDDGDIYTGDGEHRPDAGPRVRRRDDDHRLECRPRDADLDHGLRGLLQAPEPGHRRLAGRGRRQLHVQRRREPVAGGPADVGRFVQVSLDRRRQLRHDRHRLVPDDRPDRSRRDSDQQRRRAGNRDLGAVRADDVPDHGEGRLRGRPALYGGDARLDGRHLHRHVREPQRGARERRAAAVAAAAARRRPQPGRPARLPDLHRREQGRLFGRAALPAARGRHVLREHQRGVPQRRLLLGGDLLAGGPRAVRARDAHRPTRSA